MTLSSLHLRLFILGVRAESGVFPRFSFSRGAYEAGAWALWLQVRRFSIQLSNCGQLGLRMRKRT